MLTDILAHVFCGATDLLLIAAARALLHIDTTYLRLVAFMIVMSLLRSMVACVLDTLAEQLHD